MRWNIRITASNKKQFILALQDLLQDLEDNRLESNMYAESPDGYEYDYEFTDSNNVFKDSNKLTNPPKE